MYLDMHSHSVSSDDSRATVEQYLKWIGVLRKRGHVVDGIVLTEHHKFDFDKDYSALASQYGVVVLKGSELDTRYGHVLVYGVTEPLTREIDFSNVAMDTRELLKAARQHDADQRNARRHEGGPPLRRTPQRQLVQPISRLG